MKMTPENFAPVLAKAITDAFALNPTDPNAGMKTLISGLEVFQTEILKDAGAVSSKEIQLPGFMLIRSAIAAFVMEDDKRAIELFDQYQKEHPSGIFAKAIRGEAVFDMMTIEVQTTMVTAFCRQCHQNQPFQLDGQVGTCPECGWEIRFVNR